MCKNNYLKPIWVIVLVSFCLNPVYAEQYGPITSKDTLWSIASKHKPKSMTVLQYIDQLFKINPHAFKNNNVNLIIEGSTIELQKKPIIKFKKKFVVENKPKTNFKPPITMVKPLTAMTVVQMPNLINKDSAVKVRAPLTVTNQSTKITILKKKPKKKEMLLTYSYDISSSYDDNLRLAQYKRDIRDDVILHGIFKIDTFLRAGNFSKLKLGVSIQHNKHSTFTLLDNTQYSLNTRYIFSTGSSYSSSLHILKLDIGGIESSSEMRKANILKIGYDINKRISNKIVLTTGLQFQQNDSQSKVFDTDKISAFINFDFGLTRRHLIYSTYHFISGDVVSSSTPSLKVVNAATEIEADDAFGGSNLNQFAYKIESKSQVITLGYNYFKSRKLSFDISARFISSKSNENSSIYYDRTIIRAGILGRF